MPRGQGALEYILLLGAALLIAIVIISLIRTNILFPANQTVQTGLDTFFTNFSNFTSTTATPTPTPGADNLPSVSLSSPSDGGSASEGSISFGYIPVDDHGFSNATLFANFSGVFSANTSNSTSLSNNSVNNISVALSPGFYTWNVRVCDNNSTHACVFASSNRTLTVTPTSVMFCDDGTSQDACSSSKPFFCNSSLSLVANCSGCGCSTGGSCLASESCLFTWTQTAEAHFSAGTASNVSTSNQSGNVTLATMLGSLNSLSEEVYDDFTSNFYNVSVFADVNDSGFRNPYSGNGTVPWSTINFSDSTTGFANRSVVPNNGSVRLAYPPENDLLSQWALDANMTVPRVGHGVVIWNERLYVIGGQNGSYLSSAESAPILANGSLGSWRSESSMIAARDYAGIFVWNGRVYSIGGQNVGGALSSAESAPILANGSLGSWRSESSMTNSRTAAAYISWNGRVYAAGGQYSIIRLASAESAPILANGSLGAWRSESSLPSNRTGLAGTVWNNRFYVAGGYDGGSHLTSVLSAPILANGSLGSWGSEASMTTQRNQPRLVVWNGRFYAISGFNTGSGYLSSVESAPILVNGSLSNWGPEANMTTPHARPAAVVWNGRIYVTGGYNASPAPISSIEVSTILANGTLGSWRSEVSTPYALYDYGLEAVDWNSRLYTLGGYCYTCLGGSSGPHPFVQSALILGNGSLSVWRNETSMTVNRSEFGAVVWNGRVYALGGADASFNPLSSVESASILANGSLTAWVPEPSLTSPRWSPIVAVWNGRIYVASGRSGGGVPATVESAPILANGSLGTWRAESSMIQAREQGAMTVWNRRLYAVGGSYGGLIASVESAEILVNSSLGSWRSETSLPVARAGMRVVAWNGRIYASGGQATGTFAPITAVLSAPILANGSVGSWRSETSMITARERHASVVWNGRLFSVAGVGTAAVESTNVTGLAQTGSYISKVFDLDGNASLSSLSWSGYLNNGMMNVSYKSGSTLDALGSAAFSTPESSSDFGGSTSLSGTARYFQYQVNFSRGSNDWTPELNAVTLYYEPIGYVSGGSLLSQVLDAGSNATWRNMTWAQFLLSSTQNITLFTRSGGSSPPGGALLPASGVQSYYPASTGAAGIDSDNNTRYFQWLAFLNTTDDTQTPVLEEVNVTYTIP